MCYCCTYVHTLHIAKLDVGTPMRLDLVRWWLTFHVWLPAWPPQLQVYLFIFSFPRARNNGRSTDNVQTDCVFDRSNFRLAGHVDRSKFNRIENEINLRFLLFSCYLSSRCVLRTVDVKSWWHITRAVVYNSRIETDIGIRPLPIAPSNDSWEINS